MNYYDFLYNPDNPLRKVDVTKTKQINNIQLSVDKFVLGGEYWNLDDRRDYRYIIEFRNENFTIPILMEFSLKEIWNELKNHIPLNYQVVGEGYQYYNNENELVWIEITKIYIKDMEINELEILYNNEKTSKPILELWFMKNKNMSPALEILFIFVFIFGYLGLGTIFFRLGLNKVGTFFFVLELVHIFIIAVCANYINKKSGKETKEKMELSGFSPIEQEYLKYSIYRENRKI